MSTAVVNISSFCKWNILLYWVQEAIFKLIQPRMTVIEVYYIFNILSFVMKKSAPSIRCWGKCIKTVNMFQWIIDVILQVNIKNWYFLAWYMSLKQTFFYKLTWTRGKRWPYIDIEICMQKYAKKVEFQRCSFKKVGQKSSSRSALVKVEVFSLNYTVFKFKWLSVNKQKVGQKVRSANVKAEVGMQLCK